MTDDRLTLWLGFARFVLGSFVLGIVSVVINSEIQTREVELKEQEQAGEFLAQALEQDVGIRRRFAQYFATVTRSDDQRTRWETYLALVENEYQEKLKEKDSLSKKAIADGTTAQQREEYLARIEELKQALDPAVQRASLPARVYIHIADEGQRKTANDLASVLQDAYLQVPGVELTRAAPAATQVRYFRRHEREGAEEIARLITAQGVKVATQYIPGFESSSRIRPLHYELWFGQ